VTAVFVEEAAARLFVWWVYSGECGLPLPVVEVIHKKPQLIVLAAIFVLFHNPQR
jgi:hypothetical protein